MIDIALVVYSQPVYCSIYHIYWNLSLWSRGTLYLMSAVQIMSSPVSIKLLMCTSGILSSRQRSRGWVTQDGSRSRTELSFLCLCLWGRIYTLLWMGNTQSEKIDVNFSKGINYVCDSSCGVSVVYENTWLPRTTACMASARSRRGKRHDQPHPAVAFISWWLKMKKKEKEKSSLPAHGYPCWLPAHGKLIHRKSIQAVQILA